MPFGFGPLVRIVPPPGMFCLSYIPSLLNPFPVGKPSNRGMNELSLRWPLTSCFLPLHRAPTVCRHTVSGSISLPFLGCFSPFPHGTGSLSVACKYLALEGGPPGFIRDFSCPALLGNNAERVLASPTGLSPSIAGRSRSIRLAATFVTF